MNTPAENTENAKEQPLTAAITLIEEIAKFDRKYGYGASIGKALAKAVIQHIEVDDQKKDQSPSEDFHAALSRDLAPLEQAAKKVGLKPVVDLRKVGDVTKTFTADSVNMSFEVADQDIFKSSIEGIATAIESEKDERTAGLNKNILRDLLENVHNNILMSPSGKALKDSPSLQAVIAVGKTASAHNRYIQDTYEVLKMFVEDLKGSDLEEVLDLFLTYKRKLSIKLGIIATGDATLDYLQDADKMLDELAAGASHLASKPAVMLFLEQVKTRFKLSLHWYLQQHQRWAGGVDPGYEDNFTEARKFAFQKLKNLGAIN